MIPGWLLFAAGLSEKKVAFLIAHKNICRAAALPAGIGV